MQSWWETRQVEEPAVNVWKASCWGNVMLSFGILTSGAKISQALLMFKNMGLPADILLPPKEVPLPLGVKLLENAAINTSCEGKRN